MHFNFKAIFPNVIDNNYLGTKLSKYLFYCLTIMTLWRSQHHLLALDGGAQSIATIPLDLFSPDAASTVIGIFAVWGLSQIIIAFMYVLTAIRYKSLIPLMYLTAMAEYLGRLAISHYKPIVTAAEAPGSVANIPMAIVCAIALLGAIYRKN